MGSLLCGILALAGAAGGAAAGEEAPTAAKRLAPFFRPPPKWANELGKYRSPLKFEDASPVKTPADWRKRRQEILKTWHGIMGPWPELIDRPQVE